METTQGPKYTIATEELIDILREDYAEALATGDTDSPEDYASWVIDVLMFRR